MFHFSLSARKIQYIGDHINFDAAEKGTNENKIIKEILNKTKCNIKKQKKKKM